MRTVQMIATLLKIFFFYHALSHGRLDCMHAVIVLTLSIHLARSALLVVIDRVLRWSSIVRVTQTRIACYTCYECFD